MADTEPTTPPWRGHCPICNEAFRARNREHRSGDGWEILRQRVVRHIVLEHEPNPILAERAFFGTSWWQGGRPVWQEVEQVEAEAWNLEAACVMRGEARTYAEIGTRFGVDGRTVRERLERGGWVDPPNLRAECRRKRLTPELRREIEGSLADGASYREIAGECGVTVRTVRRVAREALSEEERARRRRNGLRRQRAQLALAFS